MGPTGVGVDFGGDEPGRDEPADAEDGCGEIEEVNERYSKQTELAQNPL